jgi:tetratricopeptide (TPR) repeat protein
LAVFAGSFTIGAAEEVCEADLEALAALIDFSLLKPVGDDRFLTLETIREYTLELLDESDEADDVRRRHAEHFLALVESAPGAADSPALSANVADTSAWRQQIDADYGNVRAALEWFRETGDLDREFRLVFPLAWLYIWVRGGMAEAGRMFDAVLSRAGESDLALRVDALQSLSHFGTYLDRETRRRLAEESLVLARKLGDEGRIEWSLRRLALRHDDPAESRRMLLQCEVLARELPEEGRLAWIHQNLALMALQQGDYGEARVRLEQSLVIFERIGGKWQAMNSLSGLATLAVLEERYDDAGRLLADTLRRALDLGSTNHISQCFDDVAAVALAGGDARAASRLLGAAAALRAQTGDESSEDDYTDFELRMREKTAAAARSRLAERFELEWEAGKTLTLDQAVALALDETRLDA